MTAMTLGNMRTNGVATLAVYCECRNCHMDFGTESESLPVTISGVGVPITAHAYINQQIHVVKIGVNYRFDWGRM